MRKHWQTVTQKFCLTGERSFCFEPKPCALMGPTPPALHLLQNPTGCPAPVPFPKRRLCCYHPCALCSLFGAATTPGLAKPLEPRGLIEPVQWLSPAVFGDTRGGWSRAWRGFAQKPSANAPPPGVPWLRRQTQIVCRETGKGDFVLWHNRLSHLWRSRNPLASWNLTATFPARFVFYRRHVNLLSWLYSC